MRYVERIAEAEWAQGQHGKQPRRIWAVEALKPSITEAQWEAGRRAVRECILCFPGASSGMDRIDVAWSDQGTAVRVDAGRALYGLRQAVGSRLRARQGPLCAEWIVQLYTLGDMARALGHWRNMGKGRDPIPDTRTARELVTNVLGVMADYYADCDSGRTRWNAPAQQSSLGA